MSAPLPRLDELFFPVQEVQANPDHDPAGERPGTSLKQAFNVHPLEGRPGSFSLGLTVETDRETSRNPPYFFRIEAYAIMRVEAAFDATASEALVASIGVGVVIGALRERLLEITSRAPWGRFLLQIVPIVPQPIVTQEATGESLAVAD